MRQPQEAKMSFLIFSNPFLGLCPPANSDIHQALAEWDNSLTWTKINFSPPGLVSYVHSQKDRTGTTTKAKWILTANR